MKLLRGTIASNPVIAQGCVVTVGNFDGVHCGHQALLAKLRQQALTRQVPSVVILFEPQPGEYFLKESAPARLSSLREKLAVIKQCGIDYVYCLRFNRQLASMDPIAFAQHYFFTALKTVYLLVGNDFRFGRDRQGDVDLLMSMAPNNHCDVEIFADFIAGQERISSTKIRSLLAHANLEHAAALLGRSFNLCGRVLRGDGRGRQWGVPTANLAMHRLKLPLKGVFCVQVALANGELVNGVANLGHRPTVNGSKALLEVHLLDWQGDLYGQMVQVFFVHKLRDEAKFSSIDALIAQIHHDVAAAKCYYETVI